MSRFALAVRVLRAPFFTASAVPVLLGAALAWQDGHFRLSYLILTLVGALAIHAGLNVGNDYFDHLSGNDEANRHPTPFSGGSRVIQEGWVTARQMLAISIAAYAIGIVVGLYLAAARGWPVLWLGALGMFFAVFNSAPPLRLSYVGRGLAELGIVPLLWLLALLSLPLAYRAIRCATHCYDSVEQLSPANAATVQIHLLTGLLLSLGSVLEGALSP